MYEVVFDIADATNRAWAPIFIGLVLGACGLVSAYLPRKFWIATPPRNRRAVGLAFTSFTALWLVGLVVHTEYEHRKYSRALEAGDFSIVEGDVEDFIPMPYEGHSYESFVVAGERFEYSDYHLVPGFNNSKSHGGPIDSGVYVRVSHVNGMILRLEIRR